MDQIKIGRFLKELRKEKGLTQEQLAERFNISSRTVSRWETGNNMPDLSILVEMADFYDVDIREIIDGERKSEIMNEEIKETLEKVADYSNDYSKREVKKVWRLFFALAGVLLLVILFIPFGTIMQNNRNEQGDIPYANEPISAYDNYDIDIRLKEENKEYKAALDEFILNDIQNRAEENSYWESACADYMILSVNPSEDNDITLIYTVYGFKIDYGEDAPVGANDVSFALRVFTLERREDGGLRVVKYDEPADGASYYKDLERLGFTEEMLANETFACAYVNAQINMRWELREKDASGEE